MLCISIIKLKAEVTPEAVYYYLSRNKYFCFLDSSLSESKYTRFSYFCLEPDFYIRSQGKVNEEQCFKTGKTVTKKCHPLDFLNQFTDKYIHFDFLSKNKKINLSFYDENYGTFNKEISLKSRLLPDFKGGFIGYFSYDLKQYIEKLPKTVEDDLHLPVFNLLFFRKVFSYNHKEKKWYFTEIVNQQADKEEKLECFSHDNVKKSAQTAGMLLKSAKKFHKEDEIIKKIAKKYIYSQIRKIDIRSNILKADYLKKLIKTKKYIHDGEIYQVNFTHRFFCEIPVESNDFYYILRKINPAPFSAFLNFPECTLASTSPERFIFIKDSYIETRPIKGTRPRGENNYKDKLFRSELKHSIKDRAELNMIVDLERNDLGKFCNYGSVKVKKHAVIEKYAKVFHLVSTVTGRIKKGTTISKILKSIFPGGSITGAPKIRAMQIIDEVEKNARNIYTGSLGYISVDGMADLNICIRTFIIKNKKFYYNTGGGIVEDSIPEEEYLETLQKGKALEETLRFFEYENLKKVLDIKNE
ncbi:MAG: aminodeoxychorismate synthase component I [Actinomycetota bacterium]|nr:aminodeoxychorismate synthase component I [Actinomycetota bacterium]